MILTFAQQIFAAEEATFISSSDVTSTVHAITDNSWSTFNRKNKSITVGVLPIGMNYTQMVEQGVLAEYFLDAGHTIQIIASKGTYEKSYGVNRVTAASKSVDVYYKKFQGSMYSKWGVEYRQLGFQYDYLTTQTFTHNIDASVWSAKMEIGFQWQWQSFTLGIQGFGFSLPLITDSTSSAQLPNQTDSDIHDIRSKFLHDVAIEGPGLFIGASF
jgi:hypothetical protein